MSRNIVVAIAIGALFAATPAFAQDKGNGHGGPGMGPHHGRGQGRELHAGIMESLYPVELIRENATEIKLTDEQMEKLRKLVFDVRNEIEQLEWDLERENRKLLELLKRSATKEEVYGQLDVMFGYENKIKKKHLGLLVVVRDVLNAKQRGQLDKIKDEMKKDRGRWRDARPDRGPGGPGMMPPPPGPPGPQMDL